MSLFSIPNKFGENEIQDEGEADGKIVVYLVFEGYDVLHEPISLIRVGLAALNEFHESGGKIFEFPFRLGSHEFR